MSMLYRSAASLLIAASTLNAQTPAVAPWRVTGLPTGEYTVSIDSAVTHGGKRSIRIEGLAAVPTSWMGVTQSIRVGQERGKRVRLSAYIKTRDVDGPGAFLTINVAGGAGVGASATSEASAVKGTSDWRRASVEIDVHNSALGFLVSGSLNGRGTAWIDDVSIEILGDAVAAVAPPAGQPTTARDMFATLPEGGRELDFETTSLPTTGVRAMRSALEPSRALTSRGLDNLSAFARLVGVVRHFHPTSAVRTTNWDDFTIRGIRLVESAPNADSLARTLGRLFATVAPQVRVVAGRAPKLGPQARPEGVKELGIAYWQNNGIVTATATQPNIYSSVLMAVAAPNGIVPSGAIHPDSAWTAALPGGVSAVVPLALWVELPASDAERRLPVQPAFSNEPASANDRATRIAGVIGAWNVFQHAYPYFDVIGADWTAELSRALKSAAMDNGPADYHATLRRLVAALRDGHGGVYAMSGTGRMAYLPVALEWVENQLVVTRTGDGAPPDIKRGDVIELINGVKSSDALAKREEQISSATPQWRRHRAVNDLIVGPYGTHANLRLRSGATVRLVHASALVADSLPEKISEVRPGIYYVDISHITDADFNAALPKLVAARGVVFDMRGYPRTVSTPNILSHLTGDTTRSARFQVPMIARPDRQATTFRQGGWPVPPREPRIPGKIAFLTGGGAISYAETTMGIVENFKLGEIVGAATAGTNGNVNTFVATGGYQIAYTGMLVLKHDGSAHHGIGIKATIPAPRTIRGVAEGRDEALERAIVAVGGQASVVPFE